MKGSTQGRKGRMLSPLLQASGQFTQLRSEAAARRLWDFLYVEDCIVSTQDHILLQNFVSEQKMALTSIKAAGFRKMTLAVKYDSTVLGAK